MKKVRLFLSVTLCLILCVALGVAFATVVSAEETSTISVDGFFNGVGQAPVTLEDGKYYYPDASSEIGAWVITDTEPTDVNDYFLYNQGEIKVTGNVTIGMDSSYALSINQPGTLRISGSAGSSLTMYSKPSPAILAGNVKVDICLLGDVDFNAKSDNAPAFSIGSGSTIKTENYTGDITIESGNSTMASTMEGINLQTTGDITLIAGGTNPVFVSYNSSIEAVISAKNVTISGRPLNSGTSCSITATETIKITNSGDAPVFSSITAILTAKNVVIDSDKGQVSSGSGSFTCTATEKAEVKGTLSNPMFTCKSTQFKNCGSVSIINSGTGFVTLDGLSITSETKGENVTIQGNGPLATGDITISNYKNVLLKCTNKSSSIYVSPNLTTNATDVDNLVLYGDGTCTHDWSKKDGKCTVCEEECNHTYSGGVCSNCGYVCTHASVDFDGKCGSCNTQMEASLTFDGTTIYYELLNDALSAIPTGKATTLKIYTDIQASGSDYNITIKGNYDLTIDATGHEVRKTIMCETTTPVKIIGGTFGELYANEYGNLTITNCTINLVTCEGENTVSITKSTLTNLTSHDDNVTLTLTDCSIKGEFVVGGNITLNTTNTTINKILLSGSTTLKLGNGVVVAGGFNNAEWYGEYFSSDEAYKYLADGYAYYTKDTDGNYTILIEPSSLTESTAFAVKECDHSIGYNDEYKCKVCGKECSSHDWTDYESNTFSTHSHSCKICGKIEHENHEFDSEGYCSVCNYDCPHPADAISDYKCISCNGTLIVKLESNGKTSYFTTLKKAVYAVQSGDKITILADITDENDGQMLDKTVTIDINGKKLDCGLVIRDVDKNETVTVEDSAGGGTLSSLKICDCRGGKVVINVSDTTTLGDVTVHNIQNCTAIIIGGKISAYKTVMSVMNPVSILNVIPTGYYAKDSDGNPILRSNLSGSASNITIGECTTHGGFTTDGKCGSCNTQMQASLTTNGNTTYYLYLQDAIDAIESGVKTTVKIYSDAKSKFTFSDCDVIIDATGCTLGNLTFDNSTVEIIGGTFEAIIVQNGSTLTFTGGEVTGKDTTNGFRVATNSTAKINGGTIAYVWDGGSVEITGGTIKWCIIVSGTYTISGGVVENGFHPYGNMYWDLCDVSKYLAADKAYYTKDTDGNYTVLIKPSELAKQVAFEVKDCTHTIGWTDGVCNACGKICQHGDYTYTSLDEKTHKETCKTCGKVTKETENHNWSNGNCTICTYACTHTVIGSNTNCTNCSIAIVAEVNGIYYPTLAEAMKICCLGTKPNQTVKLLADCDYSGLGTSYFSVTLDVNGHVLNVTGNQLLDLRKNNTLTIIDSNPTAVHADTTLPKGGVIKVARCITSLDAENATLCLKGGTIIGGSSSAYVVLIQKSSACFEMNGGTIIGNEKAIHLYEGTMRANGGEVYGIVLMSGGTVTCSGNAYTVFYGDVTAASPYSEKTIEAGLYYGNIASTITINGKKVTFMNSDDQHALLVVPDGKQAIAPALNPTKAGSKFEYWANGTSKYDFSSAVNDNITLTAVYSIDLDAVEDLAKDVEQLRKDLDDALGTGSSDIASKIAELAEAVKALQNAKTALEKADADNKADLEKAIETAVSSAQATLQTAIDEVQENLDNAVENLNKADTALGTRIDNLNQALEDAKTALENADEALGVRIDDLTTALDNAKNALQDAINEVQKNLNEAVENLNKADTALGTRIDNLNQALEDAKTALENADEALGVRIDDLTTALDKAKKALQEAIDEVQSNLDKAVENLNKADTALGERIDNLNQALEDAVTALEKADADNKKELQDAIADAKDKLQKAIDKVQENLDKAVENLNKADTALGERIDNLNQALKDAVTALEKADADNKSELKKDIANAKELLQAQIDRLEKYLEETRKALQESINTKADSKDLEKAVEDFNNAIAELEKAYKNADDSVKSELKALIDNAKQELQDSIDDVQKNLDEAVKDLENAIESGDKYLKELIKNLSDNMAVMQSALKATDAELLLNLNSFKISMNKATDLLQTAINKVQDNLDKAESELGDAIANGDKDLSDKIDALNKAMDEMSDVLKVADSDNKKSLEDAIATAKTTLENAIKALSDKLEKAENDVKSNADAIDDLREQLKESDKSTTIWIVSISSFFFVADATIVALALVWKKRRGL